MEKFAGEAGRRGDEAARRILALARLMGMATTRGRPRASSREILADAACELFLEQGYERTTVSEITRRAGVSRSSFFNYFAAKPDTLWFVFDEHVARVRAALAAGAALEDALAAFEDGAAPDTLALAVVDARTMGIEAELAAGRAARQLRLGDAIAERLVRDGEEPVRADILGAGYAAALVGAVWRWADLGAGRHRLGDVAAGALRTAREAFGA